MYTAVGALGINPPKPTIKRLEVRAEEHSSGHTDI